MYLFEHVTTGNILIDFWVKSIILFSLMYAIYKLFFDRPTYDFSFKRWYLMATAVFTLVVPMVSIDMFPIYVKVPQSKISAMNPVMGSQAVWDYKQIISVVFVAGMIFSLMKLALLLMRMYSEIKSSKREHQGKYVIIEAKGNLDCSFFQYIFVNNTENAAIKIAHEKIHADHFHSIDVVLSEIVKSILWFHPLTYTFSRDIKVNHEFICDKAMIDQYGLATYADSLLQQHKVFYSNTLLFNHFSSFIKKRITMMNHLKSSSNSKTNYTFLGLFLVSIFGTFSFRSYVVPLTDPSNNTQIALDSIPMDTIVTLDPSTMKETVSIVERAKENPMDTIVSFDPTTFKETVSIVKRAKENESELNLNQLLQQYPDVIAYRDTAIVLDPNTFKETVTVTEGKIVKAYQILIDKEYTKISPDFEKIQYWKQAGERK